MHGRFGQVQGCGISHPFKNLHVMVLIYGAVYKMATFNSLFVKKKKKKETGIQLKYKRKWTQIKIHKTPFKPSVVV